MIPQAKFISRKERIAECAKKNHPKGVEHDWFCRGIAQGLGGLYRVIDWEAGEHGRFFDVAERVK